MANNFTNDGEGQILRYLTAGTSIKADGFAGSSAWTPTGGTGSTTSGLYVSLHTATPGEAGSTTNEVQTDNSGSTGYSRKQIVFSAVTLSTSATLTDGTLVEGPSSGAGAVTWTASSGAPGNWQSSNSATTISHFGLHMGSTGTMIMYGALGADKTVTSTDTVTLAVDALDITLT